jgi:hypothetical protein
LLPPPTLEITFTGGGTLESSILWVLPAAAAQIAGSRLAVMTSSILSSCCSTSAVGLAVDEASFERPPQMSLPSVAR